MKYLLDTDHLSILQRQVGEDYNNLTKRMAQHSLSDFVISVVTFHEQMLGSHAYIKRSLSLDQVVKGYEIMARIVSDFKVLPVASFDASAATAYAELESQRIQVENRRIKASSLSNIQTSSRKKLSDLRNSLKKSRERNSEKDAQYDRAFLTLMRTVLSPF